MCNCSYCKSQTPLPDSHPLTKKEIKNALVIALSKPCDYVTTTAISKGFDAVFSNRLNDATMHTAYALYRCGLLTPETYNYLTGTFISDYS